MSILSSIYSKKLTENENNLRFWENYVQNLEKLDFDQFSTQLKVPILVPVGSKILFRGELKHTNEVTVALGAEYFAKCSVNQAQILRQRRVQDAKSKVEAFRSERQYIENQLSFSSQNVFDTSYKDIVEYQTDEEDKAWREKHREKVRFYKQNQAKEENHHPKNELITDEELWNKLEELELQEDLENELESMKQVSINNSESLSNQNFQEPQEDYVSQSYNKVKEECSNNNNEEKNTELDILQKVIEKQNELEKKLKNLKYRDRITPKNELDLINKLDEIEQLEELEDEMDRLDDMLENNVKEITKEEGMSDYHDITKKKTNNKRNVSFADEDDSETLVITFKHSPIDPPFEPYNPAVGIIKPSDIYQSHANSSQDTPSILKKPKYGMERKHCEIRSLKKKETPTDDKVPENPRNTIKLCDIVEKSDKSNNEIGSRDNKPISLFKQKRLNRK